jgi:hypothetical protein
VYLSTETVPIAAAAGVGSDNQAFESKSGESQVRSQAQSCMTAVYPETDRVCVQTRPRLRMQTTQQFHDLSIDVGSAGQQAGHIIVAMESTDRTGRQTGKTGLAKLWIKRRRGASSDGIDRTQVKTSRAS